MPLHACMPSGTKDRVRPHPYERNFLIALEKGVKKKITLGIANNSSRRVVSGKQRHVIEKCTLSTGILK